jgi:hypothetical protein
MRNVERSELKASTLHLLTNSLYFLSFGSFVTMANTQSSLPEMQATLANIQVRLSLLTNIRSGLGFLGANMSPEQIAIVDQIDDTIATCELYFSLMRDRINKEMEDHVDDLDGPSGGSSGSAAAA